MKPGHQGLTRLLKASQNSWAGFKAAWKFEAAFRQECILALVLIPIAIILDISQIE